MVLFFLLYYYMIFNYRNKNYKIWGLGGEGTGNMGGGE